MEMNVIVPNLLSFCDLPKILKTKNMQNYNFTLSLYGALRRCMEHAECVQNLGWVTSREDTMWETYTWMERKYQNGS
jgi:hypothetical protein